MDIKPTEIKDEEELAQLVDASFAGISMSDLLEGEVGFAGYPLRNFYLLLFRGPDFWIAWDISGGEQDSRERWAMEFIENASDMLVSGHTSF